MGEGHYFEEALNVRFSATGLVESGLFSNHALLHAPLHWLRHLREIYDIIASDINDTTIKLGLDVLHDRLSIAAGED